MFANFLMKTYNYEQSDSYPHSGVQNDLNKFAFQKISMIWLLRKRNWPSTILVFKKLSRMSSMLTISYSLRLKKERFRKKQINQDLK